MRCKLLAALLVTAVGSVGAQKWNVICEPHAEPEVDLSVTDIETGGWWGEGLESRHGTYRVIVRRTGVEHVSSWVRVEWIEYGEDARPPQDFLRLCSRVDLPGLAPALHGVVREVELRPVAWNQVRLIVEAEWEPVAPGAEGHKKRFEFELGRPGEVRALRDPASRRQ